MSPTRLAECLRACVGDATARALRPPCRTLPGRVGLGAPMVDTRTSRVSCRLGRRASCRQVGAGAPLGHRTLQCPGALGCGSGCLLWDGATEMDLLWITASGALGKPLNKTGVSAGRIRPFFQICCQSRGDAHHCCLGICGSSFLLSPLSSLLSFAAQQKALF